MIKLKVFLSMRNSVLYMLILLFSCSPKKEVNEEQNAIGDSVEVKSEGNPGEVQGEGYAINFPLDSLLKFDSEEQLKKAFGDHVKRSIGYYPEGMGEYANTLLYPDTRNQVEFIWLDDSLTFSGLSSISLAGTETDWKTKEGITLGTKLKELEVINQKSFTFSGLGWDYGGKVNWNEGRLYGRKLFITLEYPGESMPPQYEGLLGDQEIKSDSELARKANLVVYEIYMGK